MKFGLKGVAIIFIGLVFMPACGRFANTSGGNDASRYVVISNVYNEIIWALGAQDSVVGVDLSSTFPAEVKNVTTVGYHRALSAEGILSLHPTTVIHDNNIGPPQVLEQINALNIPMKTFEAKNDSIDGTKALISEMGAFFNKGTRAEELCNTLDKEMAASLEQVKQYTDHPRVLVIHFGRASNVYMVVGAASGRGDGGAAAKMIEWAGGEMAVTTNGMQRMTSPEIVAQADPDIILITDYGYDRLEGSAEQIKALPGVASTKAAQSGRIYRIEEHQLMYFGPRTGENVLKVAALLHGK